MSKMQVNQQGFLAVIAVSLLGLILVVGIVWLAILPQINHHQVLFKVNKTERIVERGATDSKYMIYTDNGVFENTDSLLNGKFNSSDIYNELEVGRTYSCDVVGFRNGFFSWYENVIKCTEVN